MKVLFKKIKKSNKLALFFYLIAIIAYIVGLVFITRSLLNLVGIETIIRVIVLIILILWFLCYLLFGLSAFITRKYKSYVILTFIQILFIGFMFTASFLINKVYNKLDMISNQEYTLYTTNLITLNETKLTSNSKLGMIGNEEDIEGNVLPKKLIEKENLKQEIVSFDDYYSMLDALYNKEIDGLFVSSNYVILFSNEEAYGNIANETTVLYTYSEELKSKTIMNTNKKLTEPFTILLMGVDSEKHGLNANAAFNGDTLMLITFNPETLNATILSIPRDTYVPIACNNNRYNKINSSAAYGTECVINTIKNLIDIPIDYYAKINFNGVIDLVNALGGVDVDVEEPDYSNYIAKYGKGVLCESNSFRDMANLVCMNTGMQHLNGEQALAYARNRHGFLESDIARNRHQQQIVEAMAKKLMSVTSLGDFENLLDAIGKNMSTNLSTNQILSFYQALKDMLINGLNGNEFINIQKTYLEVYNLPLTLNGRYVSALGYYEASLNEIKDAMNVNLGLKNEEMIKTFSYDYNEEYSSPIVGKGKTGGEKLETVPNFIGSSVSYAEEWASSHGITLSKEFICSDSTPGLIGNQNISVGTLVKSISYLTVYINQACVNNNNNSNTNEPTDNDDDDNDNTPNDSDDDIINTIPGLPGNDDSDNNNNDSGDDTNNTDE